LPFKYTTCGATPWNTRDAWHMEAELVHGVVVLNVVGLCTLNSFDP
jgi:hypothetical protein